MILLVLTEASFQVIKMCETIPNIHVKVLWAVMHTVP
jgi:hypothetical protein